MKYLKRFNSIEEYTAFIESGAMIRPNVSCTADGSVFYNPKQPEKALYIEALEDLTVSFTQNNIEYSLDGDTWSELAMGVSTPTIKAGEQVYFRASGLTATSSSGIGSFSSAGRCNVGGNILSMMYGADFEDKDTLVHNYAFNTLFRYLTNLYSAKNLILSANTLTERCYGGLFYQTGIVEAPELPATTLAPFCYANAFDGCVNLVTAPALPATIMADRCYGTMFQNCTSLINAPELPSKHLENQCYGNMFKGCVNLVKAPVLPASVVDSFAYKNMFYGCSKLSYIKALATNIDSSAVQDWVYGVASSGTFVKHPNSSWGTGASGIPNNWTIETATV